jgi:phage-related protein
MERKKYKSMLTKAESRIKSALKSNNSSMDDLLDSVNYQSDFEKKLNKFQTHSETDQLLNILISAVKNQLQNIRAFDAIDTILR